MSDNSTTNPRNIKVSDITLRGAYNFFFDFLGGYEKNWNFKGAKNFFWILGLRKKVWFPKTRSSPPLGLKTATLGVYFDGNLTVDDGVRCWGTSKRERREEIFHILSNHSSRPEQWIVCQELKHWVVEQIIIILYIFYNTTTPDLIYYILSYYYTCSSNKSKWKNEQEWRRSCSNL